MNHWTSIRIDQTTGLGSIIDTIRQFDPRQSSNSASSLLTRFLDSNPQYRKRVKSLAINGMGRTTPVTSSSVLAVIVLWLDSEEAAKVRDTAAKTLVGTLAGSEELQGIIEARRSMVTPLEKRFYSGKGNLLLGQANALVSAPGFKGDQKYNNAQGPITSPEKAKVNVEKGTNGKSGLVTRDSNRKRRAEAIKNGGINDDSHRLSLPTLAELLGHRHPTGTEEVDVPEEGFQDADEDQDSRHSDNNESDDDDESVESIHSDENDVSEMAPKKKAVRNENEDEGSEYSDSYSDSYSGTDSDSDSYSESRSESGDDENDDKIKPKAVTRKRAPAVNVQDGGKPKAKPKANQKAKTAPKAKKAAPKAKKAKATKKAKGMFQI
jgi:hypothetical protein